MTIARDKCYRKIKRSFFFLIICNKLPTSSRISIRLSFRFRYDTLLGAARKRYTSDYRIIQISFGLRFKNIVALDVRTVSSSLYYRVLFPTFIRILTIRFSWISITYLVGHEYQKWTSKYCSLTLRNSVLILSCYTDSPVKMQYVTEK